MTNRKYKMYYDYKKRTNGGFFRCHLSIWHNGKWININPSLTRRQINGKYIRKIFG